MSTTLGAALARRENALNFVRLLLAASVIFSHTWPVGGFGPQAIEGIGGWAVNGFFAASGYLIAGSRERGTFLPFLWRRALRILPAFWTCLIVTAFVIAPLSAFLAGEQYVVGSAVSYVVKNAGLYMFQWGIDSTLASVPYTGVWNGSLWTLFYEFGAYVMIGVLLGSRFVRRHSAWMLGSLLVLIIVGQLLAHGPLDVTTNLYLRMLRLGAFFVAGSFLYSIRDRLRLDAWYVPVSAAVVLAALFATGQAEWFGQLPLAYLVLWLGAALPVRIGSENDISYGVYIWAFPIQQLIVLFGLAWLGPWGTAALAFVLTVPMAWASWKLVEQPSLKLKGLVPARRDTREAAK